MLVKDICKKVIDNRGKTPQLTVAGEPLIESQCFSNKDFIKSEDAIKYISKETFNNMRSGTCVKNDIVVTLVGNLGHCALVLEPVAIAQNIIALRINEKLANPQYIFYCMKMPYFKKICEQLNRSSIQPSMNANDFLNLEIMLPSKDIQDKIVNILYNIDNQIERNNAMTKRLQVLGNTIYSNYAKTQKDTFNIQEKAEITWGQCPLGENLLENSNEKSIKYASGAGDIEDNTLSIIPKGFTDNPLRIAKEKDICISVAGTVGKIGISTEDIAIGRAMLSIRNSDLYGYLYFAINTYKNVLSKQATGAIQKIINNSHLEIINIPIEKKEIVNTLNHILDEIIRIEKNTKELNTLKNNLLPLLINGQLEV